MGAKSVTMKTIISCVCLILLALKTDELGVEAATASAWHSNLNLEREGSASNLISPSIIARAKLASQSYNAIPQLASPQDPNELIQIDLKPYMKLERDLFECVEPNRELFDNFTTLYERKFDDDSERLERLSSFATTLKRIILMNRVVQSAVLNQSNYQQRQTSIGDYHFITPLGADNAPSWYADITDCELGLMKKFIFDLFYLLDKGDYDYAFKLALNNVEHLNIFEADVFEQVANILLVKLFDRFRGDEKMNQLFKWPLYMKKLAAYAYNRQQASQPDFHRKLPYIKFAYPAYFKDLRYNLPAINRTGDNLRANDAHTKFNQLHGRKIVDKFERNKRLAVFRQRWTYVNLLNEGLQGVDPLLRNITTEPEWAETGVAGSNNDPSADFGFASAKLVATEPAGLASGGDFQSGDRFKLTRFSDLTDEEFVAYLNNDFSILGNDFQANRSAQFLEDNFPVLPLSNSYRDELAAELELRHYLKLFASSPDLQRPALQAPKERDSFRLARSVVDELIGDVGLPVGTTAIDSSESEHYNAFTRLSTTFKKTYYPRQSSRITLSSGLSESDLADERQRRYEEFKKNYGRFKAWFVRAGWNSLTEDQAMALMRLADMSWHDIKLSLFKVCCLTDQNLAILGGRNASLQYLASNTEFLCQSMGQPEHSNSDPNKPSLSPSQLHPGIAPHSDAETTNYAALELYYYYSVHFNKHFMNVAEFQRRFNTFRNNIEQIRRHSCVRGLSVFQGLKMDSPQSLSSIDSLDLRRSHSDDLNLDRFNYFQVPNPERPSQQEQEIRFDRLRQLNERLSASRASISYRRETPSLTALLGQNNMRPAVRVNYAEKLTSWAGNSNVAAQKYRLNRVDKIYQLVIQRYRFCMLTLTGSEPSGSLRQQCQSSGQLADRANRWSLSELSYQPNQRLGDRLRDSNQDQCALYRMGLEPWAEGLIAQDDKSPGLIQQAECHGAARLRF